MIFNFPFPKNKIKTKRFPRLQREGEGKRKGGTHEGQAN